MDPKAFVAIQKKFQGDIKLEVDLFASPGNKKIAQICEQVATLASGGSKCPSDPISQIGQGVVCKFPLVNNSKIPPPIEGVSGCSGINGGTLLGFDVMVAPINKDENAKNKSTENSPVLRFIQQLLGRKNALPSLAPPFCIICSGKFWRGEKFKVPL